MSKILRTAKKLSNLRATSLKGHVKYATEWGDFYEKGCQIYKNRNEFTISCKDRNFCKLSVMRTECMCHVHHLSTCTNEPSGEGLCARWNG